MFLVVCWFTLLSPIPLFGQCLIPVSGPPSAASLGAAVSCAEGVLVAGDPDIAGLGGVQVYFAEGVDWEWGLELLPTDADAVGSSFGASLAIQGEALLIGAPTHHGTAGLVPSRGGVYLSELGTSDLGEVISAPTSAAGDLFGASVAWGDGRWVAGAPGASANSGSASIFTFDPAGSSRLEQSVAPDDPAPWVQFGASVAMFGEVLVVGAPGADAFQGAIYVFERLGETWTQVAKLTALDGEPGDQLGRCVSVRSVGSQVYVVAGAPGFDAGGVLDAGKIVVFELADLSGGIQTSILHPMPEPDAGFGTSVALDGARILVGCPGQAIYEGAGFVFAPDLGGDPAWSLESVLTCTTGDYSEGGGAVAFSDGIAWLGARGAVGGGAIQGFVASDRDCDGNGSLDRCDILAGIALDSNGNGIPDPCEVFVRGDIDGDGEVGISDVIPLLVTLFVPGSSPLNCEAAGDTNTDDTVDISDVSRLLESIFERGAPPLAAPWPSCGVEQGDASCEVPSQCP